MKKVLFALALALIVPAHGAIVYTSAASFAGATGGAQLDPLSNFNAAYSTPQTFVLPEGTTLVSFMVTAPPASWGTNFSVWLNNFSDLGNRLYVFNLQDSAPTFIGIKNSTPMGAIVLTTPNNGYPFAISNFQAGPVIAPVIPDPLPTSETPEPTSMALLGSGLVGIGFVARRRKAPVTLADVSLLKGVLNAVTDEEREALATFYNDGGNSPGDFNGLRLRIRKLYRAAKESANA